jgi:hypothetical protein
MRDEDLADVAPLIANATISGRVVVGDIEEGDLDELRRAGLFIHQAEPTRGEAIPDEPQLPCATEVYFVRIAGTLLPDWAEALDRAGAELLERASDTTCICRIKIEDVNAVRALGCVSGLQLFRPGHPARRSTRAAGNRAPGWRVSHGRRPGGRAARHRGLRPRPAFPRRRGGGDHVAGRERRRAGRAGGRKIRIRAVRGGPELAQLAGQPEVAAIDE